MLFSVHDCIIFSPLICSHSRDPIPPIPHHISSLGLSPGIPRLRHRSNQRHQRQTLHHDHDHNVRRDPIGRPPVREDES